MFKYFPTFPKKQLWNDLQSVEINPHICEAFNNPNATEDPVCSSPKLKVRDMPMYILIGGAWTI